MDDLEEDSYSWMLQGPMNSGPFVRCSSQPEVSTRRSDKGDMPPRRALTPSPHAGMPSSIMRHQSTVTASTTRSSSFEGPCSHQHQSATPGARFAGSSSKLRTARVVERSGGGPPDTFVDVCVTNINPGTEARDLKKMLFVLSQEHTMGLQFSLAPTPNGCFMANVRVPSASDARLVMERLQ